MVCAIFIVYNFRIINSTIRKMWSLLIFLRTFNILIFYTEYLFTYNITRYSFNYIFTIFILSSRHDTFRKFYFRFTSGLMFFHINEYNYSPFETLSWLNASSCVLDHSEILVRKNGRWMEKYGGVVREIN